ncbi:hypothetical protein OS493_001338 [Desmophyllum pertusum]|uniref:Uncharacterized protein n=1 Tax=Desmophyllum pertusum TaxID=174260 RepID=A0A9X0CZ27_9CNID|nr:hypothetical protein OS493_001338 [Desmophyllum pertusum]
MKGNVMMVSLTGLYLLSHNSLCCIKSFAEGVIEEPPRLFVARLADGADEDEDLLRRIMCHSDKTAKSWYIRESLTELAAEASEQIAANTQPSLRKNRLTRKRRNLNLRRSRRRRLRKHH